MPQLRLGLAMLGFVLAVASSAIAGEDKGYATGEMVLGQEDAPVTIIEYASMTCPHCAAFHAETLDKLREKYIETGKVRLVFREFPLDRLAVLAAMLARCAGPERFFGMLDVLFSQQSSWARAEDPMQALEKLGRLAGISEERFQACMNDQALADIVLENRLEGQNEYDIDSTPTFVIDGEKHSGALTLAEFDKILEGRLD